MDITAATQKNIQSIRQALSMTSMQRAMSKDAQTMNKLLESMEETGKVVQKFAGAERGNNLDIKA